MKYQKDISDHWYIKKATTCSAEKCTFDYRQYLDFTSHKLLFVREGNKSGKILHLQKKAIRAVSCAGYISHTEPLFKLYDILKVNDNYKYKLLTLYYNANQSNIPIYIFKFLPDLSQGARKYEIRNPRLQPPVHIHEYITRTCRYQLAVLLNEINLIIEPLDLLKSVVCNIQNVTLLALKRTVKSYLLQKYSYYCVISNCYVCLRNVV